MKFELSRVSDWKTEIIEINTLEELIDLIKKNGEIIMDLKKITPIYDGYVE